MHKIFRMLAILFCFQFSVIVLCNAAVEKSKATPIDATPNLSAPKMIVSVSATPAANLKVQNPDPSVIPSIVLGVVLTFLVCAAIWLIWSLYKKRKITIEATDETEQTESEIGADIVNAVSKATLVSSEKTDPFALYNQLADSNALHKLEEKLKQFSTSEVNPEDFKTSTAQEDVKMRQKVVDDILVLQQKFNETEQVLLLAIENIQSLREGMTSLIEINSAYLKWESLSPHSDDRFRDGAALLNVVDSST